MKLNKNGGTLSVLGSELPPVSKSMEGKLRGGFVAVGAIPDQASPKGFQLICNKKCQKGCQIGCGTTQPATTHPVSTSQPGVLIYGGFGSSMLF